MTRKYTRRTPAVVAVPAELSPACRCSALDQKLEDAIGRLQGLAVVLEEHSKLHETPAVIHPPFASIMERIAESLAHIATVLERPATATVKAPRVKKDLTPEPASLPESPADAVVALRTEVNPFAAVTTPTTLAAPPSPSSCHACSATLTPENSSESAKDGHLIHVGCKVVPIGAPAAPAAAPIQLKAPAAAPAPKPAETPPAPVAPPTGPAAPTFEALREAALAFVDKHDKPALLVVLADIGGPGTLKLSDLAEDKRAAVLEALNG